MVDCPVRRGSSCRRSRITKEFALAVEVARIGLRNPLLDDNLLAKFRYLFVCSVIRERLKACVPPPVLTCLVHGLPPRARSRARKCGWPKHCHRTSPDSGVSTTSNSAAPCTLAVVTWTASINASCRLTAPLASPPRFAAVANDISSCISSCIPDSASLGLAVEEPPISRGLDLLRRRCASEKRLGSTFTVLGGSCERLAGAPHCAVGRARATCFAAMTYVHLHPGPEAGTTCGAMTGRFLGLVCLAKEGDEPPLTRLCCLGRLELPTLHLPVTGLIS